MFNRIMNEEHGLQRLYMNLVKPRGVLMLCDVQQCAEKYGATWYTVEFSQDFVHTRYITQFPANTAVIATESSRSFK